MTNAISALGAAAAPATASPEIKKVAKEFEAIFLRQMLGSMRQADLGDGLFDSSAQDQFRDMADGKLADSMADKGFGIADLLARQLADKAGKGR